MKDNNYNEEVIFTPQAGVELHYKIRNKEDAEFFWEYQKHIENLLYRNKEKYLKELQRIEINGKNVLFLSYYDYPFSCSMHYNKIIINNEYFVNRIFDYLYNIEVFNKLIKELKKRLNIDFEYIIVGNDGVVSIYEKTGFIDFYYPKDKELAYEYKPSPEYNLKMTKEEIDEIVDKEGN